MMLLSFVSVAIFLAHLAKGDDDTGMMPASSIAEEDQRGLRVHSQATIRHLSFSKKSKWKSFKSKNKSNKSYKSKYKSKKSYRERVRKHNAFVI